MIAVAVFFTRSGSEEPNKHWRFSKYEFFAIAAFSLDWATSPVQVRRREPID
jgi:hypothetical protein